MGYDWNVLFGNLLDNAIEAMEQIKDRFLEIRIQYDRGILGIQVKNTFDGKVNKQGERLLTKEETTGIAWNRYAEYFRCCRQIRGMEIYKYR